MIRTCRRRIETTAPTRGSTQQPGPLRCAPGSAARTSRAAHRSTQSGEVRNMRARAPLLLLALVLGLGMAAPDMARAQRGQYCERTAYSAQEITDAVRNSSLRDDLKGTSC